MFVTSGVDGEIGVEVGVGVVVGFGLGCGVCVEVFGPMYKIWKASANLMACAMNARKFFFKSLYGNLTSRTGDACEATPDVLTE